MSDAETTNAMRQSQGKLSPQRDPNHPLPMWPMAHICPEQTEISATEDETAAAGNSKERDDAVGQLARALRTAERARRAYLAKLREGDYLAALQGDVKPAEDWPTWYAEYLLGLR